MHTRFNFICLALLLGLALPLSAHAREPWHAAEKNTAGWQYMTPDERVEHQRKMRSFTTFEACRAYQVEHHAKMAERALHSGVTLMRNVGSGCELLRLRGQLK